MIYTLVQVMRTLPIGLLICLILIWKPEIGFSQNIDPGLQRALLSLEKDKKVRTPDQKKISSQLLFKMRMQQGEKLTAEVDHLQVGIPIVGQDMIKVDITAAVSVNLLHTLEALGAQILNSSEQFGRITAQLPLGDIEEIAKLVEVQRIDAWLPPVNNSKESAALGMIGSVTSQ
ncbi:MAG: hypothetical protein KDC53_25415, partial [Saprospiraceae bacterium]|nr:hypothetical protein [Saprospiraceae bacterium]